MPNPIQVLTLAELESVLDAWTPLRRIREVHIHCTDHPNHAEFRGLASVEAMRRFHQSIGMSDIAQHLTADPAGLLWTGRPFDAMPASVRGHNGTSQAGPFMIEMVGLFDENKDVFDGEQKAVVQSVVCAVLRKFALDETAVLFHREHPNTGKTCPGNALDPNAFRQEIHELLGAAPRVVEVRVPRSVERAPIDREALFGRGEEEDTAFSEVPEDEASLEEQLQLASWIDRGLLGPVAGAAGRAVDTRYRELLPYVVNTSQGLLSRKGEMETTPEDLDALITHHLTPAFDAPGGAKKCEHLLFIAHGGLNSEKGALDYAKAMAPWWRSHGVYPIFFIWESSLFQAIWQKPRELPRGAAARGELGDKLIEAATQKLARVIWRRMKANARRCSAPDALDGEAGGLFRFWDKLDPWLKKRKGKVALHALGHSTGPILLSRFMPLVIEAGFDFETLNYLAPAIRIDDFLTDVDGHLRPKPAHGIRRLRQFTMNDEAERADNVARAYRKSLLYYVREACEDDTRGRIMGLEKDLYDDGRMRSLFGLAGTAGAVSAVSKGAGRPLVEIEFAQPAEAFPQNPRTRATAHGCFDNEEATMSSVLRGILGKSVAHPLAQDRPFPWQGNSQCGDASRAAEEEDWTAALDSGCCCKCHGPGPAGGGDDDDFDLPPDGDEGEPTAPAPPDRTGSGSGPVGRRIALCVGINAYPRQPLQGCVRDSQNWAKALRRHGFEVRELRDAAATRENLMGGLRTLIRDGRAGDQLVFQFAGHGSQVKDLSGDESDRYDEVIVPVDFDRGRLWIDDDVYELCQDLRRGATLTFLMDCCHSGTNTRFAPAASRSRSGAVARFVILDDREVAAHEKLRKTMRSGPPVSERDPIPGVVSVAACRDDELAWEEDGQGNFSRHSLAVLDDVLRKGGSNEEFLEAVVGRFGDDRRQRPLLLEPASGLERARFLGGS